jgi:hypothetical protein
MSWEFILVRSEENAADEPYIIRRSILDKPLSTQIAAFEGDQLGQGYKVSTVRAMFGHIVGETLRARDRRIDIVVL